MTAASLAQTRIPAHTARREKLWTDLANALITANLALRPEMVNVTLASACKDSRKATEKAVKELARQVTAKLVPQLKSVPNVRAGILWIATPNA